MEVRGNEYSDIGRHPWAGVSLRDNRPAGEHPLLRFRCFTEIDSRRHSLSTPSTSGTSEASPFFDVNGWHPVTAIVCPISVPLWQPSFEPLWYTPRRWQKEEQDEEDDYIRYVGGNGGSCELVGALSTVESPTG